MDLPRDSRIAHDAAFLHLHEMVDQRWMLSQIDQASIKAYGLIRGPKPGTEKEGLKKISQAPVVFILQGDFRKHIRLNGELVVISNYYWEMPLGTFSSVGSSEDTQRYSAFSSGGTVIFHYNEEAKNAAKFNPVYLIPDEWANFVLPAFKFQQANQALFDETKVAANLKPLTVLLSDANPFNAIAAARVLGPQRGLDAAFVSSSLDSSTGYTQAIFAYLTFKNAHPLRQEAIDNALGQVIDKASSAATLKWITLGLTTAQNDDAQSYFTLKDCAKILLLRVDKRQKMLNTKTPDDDYVNELLIVAQVRERPVTPPQTSRTF